MSEPSAAEQGAGGQLSDVRSGREMVNRYCCGRRVGRDPLASQAVLSQRCGEQGGQAREKGCPGSGARDQAREKGAQGAMPGVRRGERVPRE